jgi:uncharacterized protein YciI
MAPLHPQETRNMLYAFYCSDKPEAAGVRAANRDAHLAFLGGLGDRLFVAGPLLSDDGSAMVGSLLIIECDDLAAARALAARDPYAQAGLFSSVVIKPWRKTLPK